MTGWGWQGFAGGIKQRRLGPKQFWRSLNQSFFFCCGQNRAARFEGQQTQQDHGQGGVFIRRQTQLSPTMQAKAVEQLRLVRWQTAGQGCKFCRIRVVGVGLTRHRLQHRHAL